MGSEGLPLIPSTVPRQRLIRKHPGARCFHTILEAFFTERGAVVEHEWGGGCDDLGSPWLLAVGAQASAEPSARGRP